MKGICNHAAATLHETRVPRYGRIPLKASMITSRGLPLYAWAAALAACCCVTSTHPSWATVVFEVQSSTGDPGGPARVCVVMHGKDLVGAAQMQLSWDPSCLVLNTDDRCDSDGKFIFQTAAAGASLTAVALAIRDVLPDEAQLFCCNFTLNSFPPASSCPVNLTNANAGSAVQRGQVPVTVRNGVVYINNNNAGVASGMNPSSAQGPAPVEPPEPAANLPLAAPQSAQPSGAAPPQQPAAVSAKPVAPAPDPKAQAEPAAAAKNAAAGLGMSGSEAAPLPPGETGALPLPLADTLAARVEATPSAAAAAATPPTMPTSQQRATRTAALPSTPAATSGTAASQVTTPAAPSTPSPSKRD